MFVVKTLSFLSPLKATTTTVCRQRLYKCTTRGRPSLGFAAGNGKAGGKTFDAVALTSAGIISEKFDSQGLRENASQPIMAFVSLNFLSKLSLLLLM